jgi:hypothetical protein
LHHHLGCHCAQLRRGQTEGSLLQLCDLDLLHLLLLKIPKMEELLTLLSYKLLQLEIAWLHRHSLLNLFELSLKIEQVLR